MDYKYTFSVFTPTFNRAHTLPRVFESLAVQTFRDFEWIVVDDGSTDSTRQYISSLSNQASFPIKYLYQNNSGKHVAHNNAVLEAQGKLFIILDSDDWFVPNALERFIWHWLNINEVEREMFAGVTALCSTVDGKIVGTRFPSDIFDSNQVEVYFKYKVKGDKKGFYTTEIMRRFPFPLLPGEKFVTEGLVWNRIGLEFKVRYINEVLSMVEYLNDGYSASSSKIRASSPNAARLYYEEFIINNTEVCWIVKIRMYINYIRYCLHSRCKLSSALQSIPSRLYFMIGLPIGFLLFYRDKRKIT